MISNSSRIIGAVEIGTGKVTVLVGEIARGRSLNIIGVGVAPSRGVMKGEVVDYKAACEATHHALEMAEKRAGAKLEEVWLAQSGGHLDAFYNEASLWPGPRKVKADGSGFDPYVPGVDGPPLTLGGELNKLAMNLTHGRDASGVHWRTDGLEGLRQGEELAIRILREARAGYPEPPSGWTLTKFDGTPVAI